MDDGRSKLDQAYDWLERETPPWVARAFHWLRNPRTRPIRLPLGVLLIIGGLLSFLPVLGIEMLPIGLMLIALDVPFLRRPVANMAIWLEHRWEQFRAWRQRRRQK